MTLDPILVREQFPSLKAPVVFFDNPGGTQIARHSLDRMNDYLLESNANHGGAFATSIASDAIIDEARQAIADFYNATSPDEIIFGPNMTTLTFQVSRSISREWQSGDEILLTRLDHDANATPWVLAAEDRGCKIRWVNFNLQNGILDMQAVQSELARQPRLLAIGYASNALGTINPVEEIIKLAHDVGTIVYVDAVQYAPHGSIDVQALDCDFLVTSAYKFFGPHMGVLYGKRAVLEELFAYKVRPASDKIPGRFETGTQNHEGIAGVLGAIDYFEWLGKQFGDPTQAEGFTGRRRALKQAMHAIHVYELELSRALLSVLDSIHGLTLYGQSDPEMLEKRVATFSFRLGGMEPRTIASKLAKRNIYTWDGNYYAINVTEQLGLEDKGGMLRVGAVHYNTLEEIDQLKEALIAIAKEV